jgi:hypothetical protein
MAEIEIEQRDAHTFDVTVKARQTTTHQVTLSAADYERLAGGRVSETELVRLSFEFLLEREPNTSILSRFDLPVIARYFPEYEQAIRQRF